MAVRSLAGKRPSALRFAAACAGGSVIDPLRFDTLGQGPDDHQRPLGEGRIPRGGSHRYPRRPVRSTAWKLRTDPRGMPGPSTKAVLPVSLRPVAICQSLGRVHWRVRAVKQPALTRVLCSSCASGASPGPTRGFFSPLASETSKLNPARQASHLSPRSHRPSPPDPSCPWRCRCNPAPLHPVPPVRIGDRSPAGAMLRSPARVRRASLAQTAGSRSRIDARSSRAREAVGRIFALAAVRRA